MRKFWAAAPTAAASLAMSLPASAATYLFQATGTAGSFYTANLSSAGLPNPVASITSGDSVSVSFTFETSGHMPDQFYAADPTINIYGLTVSSLSVSVGSFVFSAPNGQSTFSDFQLWNNYAVSGVGSTDSLSIGVVQALGSGQSPVALGAGQINVIPIFDFYDFTATARSSDDINEEPPLTAYGSQSGQISFYNEATNLQTLFAINNFHASLTPLSAVPEPASWAMMAAGFGMVGASMRRRNLIRLGEHHA